MPTFRKDLHLGHDVALVETDDIRKGAITTELIDDLAVTTPKIDDLAVTTPKIDDKAITTDKIADEAVTTPKIADKAVTTPKIADEAVTTEKIANNAVTGEKIANGTIQGEDIAPETIEGRHIKDNALGGEHIADETIEGRHFKDNSIPGEKIKDGTIESVDIKDGTLPGTKLVDGTVSGAKLSDNAIESRHLLDNSIPGEKIKDNTIENVDIKDGTLGGEKIKDNTIEGTKIADGAIGTDKIVDNSVNTGKIADGAVTESKIADNSVTNAKIGAGAVTTEKIENEAITEEKLAPGAVTTEKLSDGMIEQLQTITDAEPTAGSVKPVQSSGVQNELALGAVYDVSAKNPTAGPNNDGKFESLSALLSDASLNALIPTAVRRGGMSVKFVQSSDNKYVQYRYMGTATTGTPNPFLDEANWQGVDAVPTPGSRNLVESGGVRKQIANLDVANKSICDQVFPVDMANWGIGYISNNLEIGEEISLSRVEHYSWVSAIIPCSEGDTIMINGHGANLDGVAILWAFVDSQNKIISKTTYAYTDAKIEITAPANAANFIYNNALFSMSSGWCCYKGHSSIDELQEKDKVFASSIGLYIEPYENGALGNDGTRINTSANYNLSDYIPVKQGNVILYKGVTANPSTFCAICGYDEQKETPTILLAGSNLKTQVAIIEIPDTIKYVRICSGSSVNPNYEGSYWRISGSYSDYQAILDSVEDINSDIESLNSDITDIKKDTHYYTEILPVGDRLTDDLVVEDGKVGDWAIRYDAGGNSVTKNQDGSFRVSFDPTAGNNPAFWLLNVIPESAKGKRIKFTVKLKLVSGTNPIRLTGVKSTTYDLNIDSEFKEYVIEEDNYTNSFSDMRIMFYSNSGTAKTFDIQDASFEIVDSIQTIQPTVTALEREVENIVDAINIEDIDIPLRNLQYKIASILRGSSTAQGVIALLGDSWTQHSWSTDVPSHGEEGGYNHHSNYVQPLTKYLRQKYGDAGAGYYSFSESHIGSGDTKMMSADYDDAWDERSANSSGLITYRDQSEGCMGIDAADATFHVGAYLTLHVTTPQSKFVIHFYGAQDAGKFTYTLDSEAAVEIDASNYNGYSTVVINTTDSTHILRLDCIYGDAMIFGVDMQRSAPGIRVHKIGNKGAQTTSYIINNAETFEAGIQALGLDSMTILLGTNDAPSTSGSTIEENLVTITNRVKDVNPYIDLQIIQPSNNESKSLEYQVSYQRNAAKIVGAGFVNLMPLFGSVAQINEKDTCTGVHPTLDGGYMIFEYLVKRLNLFKL